MFYAMLAILALVGGVAWRLDYLLTQREAQVVHQVAHIEALDADLIRTIGQVDSLLVFAIEHHYGIDFPSEDNTQRPDFAMADQLSLRIYDPELQVRYLALLNEYRKAWDAVAPTEPFKPRLVVDNSTPEGKCSA